MHQFKLILEMCIVTGFDLRGREGPLLSVEFSGCF